MAPRIPRAPAQVPALLGDLVDHLPGLLGPNLIGIYLYGSLTQRAFDPRRSDVDGIVVTQRRLSAKQFTGLSKWLARNARSNTWTKRLQMTFLQRGEVLTKGSKSCLYQFGHLERSVSDGNPIIWVNVLESGVVLYGPRPESFVPPITREVLFQALEREVGYIREEICEKPRSKWRDVPFYRAYAVLTLCRILYSFRKGAIVSKPRAAKWASKQFRGVWRDLIVHAIDSDAGGTHRAIPLRSIKQFVDFAGARLRDPIDIAPRPS